MTLSELLQRYQNIDADQMLYSEREEVTSKLLQSEPLNFNHYLHRVAIHHSLGYSDLAAADAYRALTLLETYFEPDFSDFHPELRNDEGEIVSWPDDDQASAEARINMAECLRCLVLTLTDLGCLRDAYTYLVQLEGMNKDRQHFAHEECQELRHSILRAKSPKKPNAGSNGEYVKGQMEPARLRNFGFARREIYRWNSHEPERSSSATRDALNEMLKPVAPHLEVRSVELPVLANSGVTDCSPSGGETIGTPSQRDRSGKSLQLGLFAKTDLPASSEIHHEPYVLAAVRPLDASLCHNCGVSIPEPLSACSNSSDKPVCCPSCADAAVFCSHACLDIAQTKYHSTTCGNEFVDPLGRDEISTNPSEDLYFLLLARAFAMSQSQKIHPLELPETKYLCGVFAPDPRPGQDSPRTLPFTFQHNIVLPFRLLSILSEEHPEMSPFSPQGLDWYDTWVVQTLYAKFRGVASARQSTWDGKPEVAAVHPFWCLANHSCAPNVEWGWGRERVFRVRDQPVRWGEQKESVEGGWKGIGAGEEILTHYCDIDLEVRDRREYMLGSLGGQCMCERCAWELGKISIDTSAIDRRRI